MDCSVAVIIEEDPEEVFIFEDDAELEDSSFYEKGMLLVTEKLVEDTLHDGNRLFAILVCFDVLIFVFDEVASEHLQLSLVADAERHLL